MCKTCALGIAVPLIFQTPSLYKQTFCRGQWWNECDKNHLLGFCYLNSTLLFLVEPDESAKTGLIVLVHIRTCEPFAHSFSVCPNPKWIFGRNLLRIDELWTFSSLSKTNFLTSFISQRVLELTAWWGGGVFGVNHCKIPLGEPGGLPKFTFILRSLRFKFDP